MIERYQTPELERLWSDQNRFALWQKVELAVAQAWSEAGKISSADLKLLLSSKPVSVERVNELDRILHHDVLAFLTAWGEQSELAEVKRHIHFGMTSSDLIDTGLALQLREAGDLIRLSLKELKRAVKALSLRYKDQLQLGRTHGIMAEPITFGWKAATWWHDLDRAESRLSWGIDQISVGMFSGPVGTYSHLPPEIECRACEILSLDPAPISTQVIARDRHADFVFALTQIGVAIEKIATELRHLQRSEVREIEEPFYDGQKGSSAMPHKRNPWRSENLCGLARILRSHLLVTLENIPLWHERDISHSSTERIIFPDATQLVHFMLRRLTSIVSDLRVYPENMRRNLNLYGGLIHSHGLLLALIDKGLNREEAYAIVQSLAQQALDQNLCFRDLIEADSRISERLSSEELSLCFENKINQVAMDQILKKSGIFQKN
ncbi:MAG: adenylosuccinate lyase [Candidatus Caenarcaniphilales bacterium]|nr:adenylosuccinate lyase [Candidatus Caenarcaniphilales bacterium]